MRNTRKSAEPWKDVESATTARMKRTRQRDNDLERTLRSELHKRGLRYRLHCKAVGNRRTVDIAFIAARVAVFVDGCFWHGCPEHGTWPKNNAEWWRNKIEKNIERDRDTDRQLRLAGWDVIRVWEHEDAARAAGRVGKAVRQRLIQREKTRP